MPNSRGYHSRVTCWGILVFWERTLTSGIESAGEVAGAKVGTTEGDLDTTAGVFGSAFAVAGVGKGG